MLDRAIGTIYSPFPLPVMQKQGKLDPKETVAKYSYSTNITNNEKSGQSH
jgi:hypothetical protein